MCKETCEKEDVPWWSVVVVVVVDFNLVVLCQPEVCNRLSRNYPIAVDGFGSGA